MALIYEEESREQAMWETARRMLTAARTAPKGRGVDSLVMAAVGKEEIKLLAAKMLEIGEETQDTFYARDAEGMLKCDAAVIIGTKIEPLGLTHCGFCGFGSCAEKRKHPDAPCAFNTGDLGIAVGSAVSVAMDCRADNRIMFKTGKAAIALKMLGKDVKIAYGIPLSCSGKNVFFDRKWPIVG